MAKNPEEAAAAYRFVLERIKRNPRDTWTKFELEEWLESRIYDMERESIRELKRLEGELRGSQ